MTDAVPFAVVQFDYRRASTRWRAAMALDEAGRRELHRELCGQGQTGFVQVATCNRTTWIAAGSSAEWLGQLLVGQVVERVGAAFPDEAPWRTCSAWRWGSRASRRATDRSRASCGRVLPPPAGRARRAAC